MYKIKDSAAKTTTIFCDDAGVELHTALAAYKATNRIIIYPYSYSQARGVQPKKIAEIEYGGWATVAAIPTAIRPGARFAIADRRTKEILRALTRRLPTLTAGLPRSRFFVNGPRQGSDG